MSVLETKVPPPVVAAVLAGMVWLAAPLVPSLARPAAPVWIAIAVAALGAVIELAAAAAFLRARTTVDPMHPHAAQHLVLTGPYRFSRNPMYLGDLLILMGWALYVSNAVALAAPLLFVLYMDLFQIPAEERALSDTFGERYTEFRTRVRRWF
jgi:protein-S-isoprenylcysteine O-methyltransferase Ste14